MAEIILALDVAGAAPARALLDRLPGLRWVKVGSTLFTAAGPDLVREFRARGLRVFLDLKWHDIPHQVAGSVRAAADLGVDLVTVHALGGPAMLAAAAEAAGPDLRVAAVSVLTSHDAADWAAVVGRPVAPALEVERLAALAAEAGLRALVASPAEASQARTALGPDGWVVTPGIRPAGTDAGDQRRVATAAAAVAAGATHLVVGRAITGAADPRAVYEELCHDAGPS